MRQKIKEKERPTKLKSRSHDRDGEEEDFKREVIEEEGMRDFISGRESRMEEEPKGPDE